MIAFTVVPALMHGELSGDPVQQQAAARRIESFPERFGDWEMSSRQTLAPGVVRDLRCTGYFHRQYVHQLSGEGISVIFMVGPPGPIVRHAPEVCYGNLDNVMTRDPDLQSIKAADGRVHRFRLLHYETPGASKRFSICYGWFARSVFEVPDAPRMYFGGEPLLYKLQILSDDEPFVDSQPSPPWSRFLADFLPAFQATLIEPKHDHAP